jgi:hypothetical protein
MLFPCAHDLSDKTMYNFNPAFRAGNIFGYTRLATMPQPGERLRFRCARSRGRSRWTGRRDGRDLQRRAAVRPMVREAWCREWLLASRYRPAITVPPPPDKGKPRGRPFTRRRKLVPAE